MAAVIDDDTNRKSTRQHFIHSINFNEQVRQKLGVIDGDAAFGRFFLAVGPFIDLLDEIEEGLKRGRLKTEKILNKDALDQIRKIWFGDIYIVVVRDPHHQEIVLRRDICYNKGILLQPNEELIRLPCLRNMNPTDQIKDEQMLLGIREPVNIPDAMDAQDWQSVILVGGLTYNFRERKKPQFANEEEFISSRGQIMDVGRPYFHAIINFLHYWFRKKMVILVHDIDFILLDDFKNSNSNLNEDEYHIKSFTNKLD